MRNATVAIFDLDGSLIETDEANSAAYKSAFAQFGIRGAVGFHGRVTADMIRKFCLNQADIDAIINVKTADYGMELWRTRLGPASEAFRDVLVNRSMFEKVVLLSNGSDRRVMETLRHYGWADFFDEIVCNGGRGNKYLNYFSAFDSNPAASVVWENEEGQVMSAIAAGVKVENIRKVG